MDAAKLKEAEIAATIDSRAAAIAESATIDAGAFVRNPGSTIVPAQLPTSSADAVARALLDGIAERAPATATAFVMERTLGEGGMGVVHLATQVVLDRKVAVKTVKPEQTTPEARVKLVQEAWITGRLEHPNIVPVYDIGTDAYGGPAIVLKRIEGDSWRVAMRDEARTGRGAGAVDPLAWNLRVLLQVCNAVHFAHSRGVVHRDLKPDNVMLGEFGEVYVLDWGLAVSLRDDDLGRLPRAADARDIAGTPSYMAPEMLGEAGGTQITGGISARTDVYLLGAILFEILAGHEPHRGRDLSEIILSILLSPPKLPPSVPDEAARICARAMARVPDDRYASADELRRELEAFLEHRGSTRLSSTADERASALVATLAGTPSPERVFDLLGECRFGYRAALDVWPENASARAGLDRALEAVVRYELAHGTARAAAALLAEIERPSADLTEQVEALRAAEAKAAARVVSLEKLDADLDPRSGAATRIFMAVLFCAMWTLLPLFTSKYVTYTSLGYSFAGYLLAAAVVGIWAYPTMSKTLLNRRLFGILVMNLSAQLLLLGGCAVLGIPLHQTEALLLFLWGVVLLSLGIFVDVRIAIPAVADVVGFFVAARYPELRHVAMSATSFLTGATLVGIWLPHRKYRTRRPKAGGP